MAIRSADYDEPLLLTETYIEGMVNYKGENIKNNNSEFGGWKSASRVITIGGVESFIIFGVSANLISFLTIQLGQSTATAAQNINAWSGITLMLPVLTAYVGDSYLGRFRTILFSTIIYILGLGLLTLCTSQLATCSNIAAEDNLSCPSPSTFDVIFFFSSLYLIGFGGAGYRTCVPAFGADQIGELNSQESKSNSSFFNWWVLGQSVGSCSSHLILHYVQDNLGWGLAFGISCISMVIALIVILSGIRSYRYTLKKDADKMNPFKGITSGLVNTVKNWRTNSSSLAITIQVDPTTSKLQGSRKAVTAFTISMDEGVLRVVPVWIICLTYPIVQSQVTTFFIKQASTMDRSIGPYFQIPTASIQIFLSISIILFAAMYSRTFVPIAQAFTGKPYGMTTLQRIGGGIFISAMSMVVAGLGLVFAAVGFQEFFYDQVPNGLRSVGLSLFSTMFAVGHFLSVLLISVVQKVTTAGGQHGWIANNINQAHLDYFYWFLACLSVIELVAFLCFSKSYVYKHAGAPM
ncbi:protein NRT1/ PTR FAMILY 5.10-like isoform X2 [Papaver somniferum]|uniref:protein NRT1/ PTR FAMILY 5.10-like isoform X2 n=1 Tax=Papaver somniferum TaxID=3469 RepID=UPI000E6FCD6C|nr:protein NRT1/ PTR FAMILY 5.10-like isoform X2 [Papaver somniferum]